MRLKEIVERLNLKVKTGSDKLDREVKRGYVSDLLSDVMANSKEGDIWVTLQTHENIVAIASLKELTGIILINRREPAKETAKKAEEKGVPILLSELPAFELVGKLYKLGIPGV